MIIPDKLEECPICGEKLGQAEYDLQFHADHWMTFPAIHVGLRHPPKPADKKRLAKGAIGLVVAKE